MTDTRWQHIWTEQSAPDWGKMPRFGPPTTFDCIVDEKLVNFPRCRGTPKVRAGPPRLPLEAERTNIVPFAGQM